MNLKKLKALAYLGWNFFLHFFKKIFTQTPNKKTFLNYYKPDGIFTIEPLERQNMAQYSQCLTCKLCDLSCPELQMNSKFPGPSYIVQSYSRSLPDYKLLKTQNLNCEKCNICEEACPFHVPIKSIIDFMTQKAQVI